MKYANISPTMREFLGVWLGLRKLGFQADTISCVIAQSAELQGALALYCVLTVEDKEFSAFCGPVSRSEKQTRKEYKRCAAAMGSNELSQADLDRIWEESKIQRDPDGFLNALYAKGLLEPDDAPDASKGLIDPEKVN